MRDYVLSCGALLPLLNLLSDTRKVSMLRNATWTLSNFCRGKNPQPDWNLVHPALPMLAKLIYSLDDEVLIDACWAISYLSDGANEKIQAVIEAGVPRRLVELLMHSHSAVHPRLNKFNSRSKLQPFDQSAILSLGTTSKLKLLSIVVLFQHC